jgi:hypothetical protein
MKRFGKQELMAQRYSVLVEEGEEEDDDELFDDEEPVEDSTKQFGEISRAEDNFKMLMILTAGSLQTNNSNN